MSKEHSNHCWVTQECPSTHDSLVHPLPLQVKLSRSSIPSSICRQYAYRQTAWYQLQNGVKVSAMATVEGVCSGKGRAAKVIPFSQFIIKMLIRVSLSPAFAVSQAWQETAGWEVVRFYPNVLQLVLWKITCRCVGWCFTTAKTRSEACTFVVFFFLKLEYQW